MYKRVLLKFSGEALKAKDGNQIFDVDCIKSFSNVIKNLHDNGVEIAVVVGAGNIWRGKLASQVGIEPVPADYMGMLGTVINCVAIASACKGNNLETVVYSAVPAIEGVTYNYDIVKANKDLADGKIVFLAGGTGKPFYTTDTAATMRAIELNCEAILMGKHNVQGVYDKDPMTYKDARFFPEITFREMIKLNLQVMDQSAIELIKDKDINIRVFSMDDPDNFVKVANGSNIGTTCKKGE